MAENTVEIVVKSRDSTKAGFAGAVASAEIAGGEVERAWSKHADKIGKRMEKVGENVSLGLIGTIVSGITSAGTAVSDGLAKVLPGALSNPGVLAAAAAGVVVLGSFIAQQIGGALVVGLGAALTGLAIYGAMKSKGVQAVFSKLKNDANKDITDIGKPFRPVMENIFSVADRTLGKLTPVFKSASAVIAGPFTKFADALIKAFGQPAVQNSIKAVASAFGKILNAVTPQLSKDIGALANDITAIANNIAKHPQAFADFISFLFGIANIALKALNGLIAVASFFEYTLPKKFDGMRHGIANVFDGVRHDVAHYWDMIFENSIGMVIRLGHNVETQFNSVRHEIAVIFDGVRHEIANIWDTIWRNTVTRLENGIRDVMRDIEALPGKIGNVFRSAGSWLYNHGKAIITGLWDGVKHIWNDVSSWFARIAGWIGGAFSGAGSWLYRHGKNIISGMYNGIKDGLGSAWNWVKKHIYEPIVGAVKGLFGIKSPSTVFHALGGHIVTGFLNGILKGKSGISSIIKHVFGGATKALGHLVKDGIVAVESLPSKALNALQSVGGALGNFFGNLFGGGGGNYKPGAGVNQWRSVVEQALKLNGLPTSLTGQVLYQMQTESGGNPRAINLSDINAQHGDPSRGLLQVIGSTFGAYHVRGTSNNIYNPLANVAAAINYAKHVYGPALMNHFGGLGSGHGYAAGGPAAGWAWVGEHGRELVRLPNGSQVYPNGASESMAKAGGVEKIVLEVVDGGSTDFTRMMVHLIKNYVRTQGGKNVQTAFGG